MRLAFLVLPWKGPFFLLALVTPSVVATKTFAGDDAPPYVVAPKEAPLPAEVGGPSETPKKPASLARERSTVEMARLGAGFYYVRGAKFIGVGTRTRYEVLVGNVYLDVTRFPTNRVGFEIHVHGGPVGIDENAQAEIALNGAGLVAPFRWKGDAPGSFVLGVGGAFELGRPVWLAPGFRGFPFALARLRVFPSESLGLQTTYRFVPITTDDALLQEHDVELSVSTGLLEIGLRFRLDEVTGGQPTRFYRSYGGGLFASLVVF